MLGAIDKGANVLDVDNSSMDGVQETNQAAIDLSGELLRKYSMDSNDATIIANAMLSGINSVVSHDYMFKDVCGINLYTKNTKILNDAGQVSTTPINFEVTSNLYNLKNS